MSVDPALSRPTRLLKRSAAQTTHRRALAAELEPRAAREGGWPVFAPGREGRLHAFL
ncbi:hypothetical protein [Streptomyces sp. NPDC088725]|uniref:hypothetical protein n=1 Tax=Streptomyces sp. NPDC088725 TaxID=3365873 RepID=UPI0038123EE1